jgi:hypothetical protein
MFYIHEQSGMQVPLSPPQKKLVLSQKVVIKMIN